MPNPVRPLGHHVLIEIIPVQFKSAGGIILTTDKEEQREHAGRDLARVLEFGPTAYMGYSGCDCPEDWGVAVGDVVELRERYAGKYTSARDYDPKYKNLRYVNDSDIIGVFSDDLKEQLIKENGR